MSVATSRSHAEGRTVSIAECVADESIAYSIKSMIGRWAVSSFVHYSIRSGPAYASVGTMNEPGGRSRGTNSIAPGGADGGGRDPGRRAGVPFTCRGDAYRRVRGP